jgi:hypothetical protein
MTARKPRDFPSKRRTTEKREGGGGLGAGTGASGPAPRALPNGVFLAENASFPLLPHETHCILTHPSPGSPELLKVSGFSRLHHPRFRRLPLLPLLLPHHGKPTARNGNQRRQHDQRPQAVLEPAELGWLRLDGGLGVGFHLSSFNYAIRQCLLEPLDALVGDFRAAEPEPLELLQPSKINQPSVRDFGVGEVEPLESIQPLKMD